MPKFWCWTDDDGPDHAEEIENLLDDAEDAAAEWAEWAWYNQDGWEWMRDGCEVNVRDEAGKVTRLKITVDYSPSFSARQVMAPKSEEEKP